MGHQTEKQRKDDTGSTARKGVFMAAGGTVGGVAGGGTGAALGFLVGGPPGAAIGFLACLVGGAFGGALLGKKADDKLSSSK